MDIRLPDYKLRYEVSNILRVFLPDADITADKPSDPDSVTVICRSVGEQSENILTLVLGDTTKVYSSMSSDALGDIEHSVCRMLYKALCEVTGQRPPWGILTGVRPARLLRGLLDGGKSDAEAAEIFTQGNYVSREKTELCFRTLGREKALLSAIGPEDVSLYITIPFCPSRCSYCTFVSHSVESAAKLIPDYVDRLVEEIEANAALVKDSGRRIKTIYVGGGTPTALSAAQLERILSAVAQNFDLNDCNEYTVEAGRPDTITDDKLALLCENGVTRISINPQTLNDSVLERIGRRHTARQFFDVYAMARSFPLNINVDLIAGLDGDDEPSFRRSLDGVIYLAPENITVHTLTVKHGAELAGRRALLPSAAEASDMISYAHSALADAEYAPYYLYRQKGTIGALENVGYTRADFDCGYNVYIMEECHTIIAAGAGGVTKLVAPDGRVSRVFNLKYPYEYISRFDEILGRKREIADALK